MGRWVAAMSAACWSERSPAKASRTFAGSMENSVAGRDVEQSWKEQFDDGEWTTFHDVLDRLIRLRPTD
jgi:hypothetical protein